jgi:hypothetical protein
LGQPVDVFRRTSPNNIGFRPAESAGGLEALGANRKNSAM